MKQQFKEVEYFKIKQQIEIDLQKTKCPEDYCRLIESFKDRNLKPYRIPAVTDIFAYAVTHLNKAFDLNLIASYIVSPYYLGDHIWARKIFQKAIELSETSDDYCFIALNLADKNGLNDEGWARQVYYKAISLAVTPADYARIIGGILDKNGLFDQKMAIELGNRMITKFKNSSHDLSRVALILTANFNDKYTASNLLSESLAKAKSWDEVREIGELINYILDDPIWAKKVLAEVVELSSRPEQFTYIASYAADILKDKKWARELFVSALKKAVYSHEFLEIAISVSKETILGDKNWAREIIKIALTKAINFNDYSCIGDFVGASGKSREPHGVTNEAHYLDSFIDCSFGLDDKIWAGEINKLAASMSLKR